MLSHRRCIVCHRRCIVCLFFFVFLCFLLDTYTYILFIRISSMLCGAGCSLQCVCVALTHFLIVFYFMMLEQALPVQRQNQLHNLPLHRRQRQEVHKCFLLFLSNVKFFFFYTAFLYFFSLLHCLFFHFDFSAHAYALCLCFYSYSWVSFCMICSLFISLCECLPPRHLRVSRVVYFILFVCGF